MSPDQKILFFSTVAAFMLPACDILPASQDDTPDIATSKASIQAITVPVCGDRFHESKKAAISYKWFDR